MTPPPGSPERSSAPTPAPAPAPDPTPVPTPASAPAAGRANALRGRQHPRAGRDLRAAILVGLLLSGAILASLLTVRHLFIGIVAAAVAVATWELASALRRGGGIRVALPPVLIGGQAMVWLSWPFGLDGLLLGFMLTVLACLVWRFGGGAAGYVRDVSASIFTAAYVPGFAAFAVLLVVPADGAGRVLCFMIAVVASDVGGYAAGVLGGRHPIAPSISPKKSWEGCIGSLVMGTVASAVAVSSLLGGELWQGALFGAAIVLIATMGDLVESLVKRDIGVKDMGSLLPGHGGLMDRLDSLLPSAVVSWLLLSAFLPA